jgi:hypothetical protein
MQNQEFEDKRVFARLPVSLSVKYLDLGSNTEGEALTQDISAKGMGLTMGRPLAPNSSLEMWLRVPDKGEPFYTRGEVVWSQEHDGSSYRAGINLERADLMGISRVLRTVKSRR